MAVVEATLLAGRSHKVATIAPHICIKDKTDHGK